ncbi:MAG: ATP synthase F1 subunit epsilon [Melioribacteraceae bacterium]|nr:MAG: ATP synthase F1 subunit epsilon [Melioribacteraceae bacterium]
MKEINVEIVTPAKSAYTGKATSVTVPGAAGSFQILFNHAPIISSLDIGLVKIVELDGKILHFAASGGTVEVLENNVLLLVESIELPEEIDVKRAEEAKQRAKERLSINNTEKVDIVRAEAALKRAVNRLKISEKQLQK